VSIASDSRETEDAGWRTFVTEAVGVVLAIAVREAHLRGAVRREAGKGGSRRQTMKRSMTCASLGKRNLDRNSLQGESARHSSMQCLYRLIKRKRERRGTEGPDRGYDW
jgi:hypothetical protein